MTDDSGAIPIDGEDDEVPPKTFHEPEPEEFEGLFSWAARKVGELAEGTVEAADRASELVDDMKRAVDANPEIEIMAELTLGAVFNRVLEERIVARLPETSPAFRERFSEMIARSRPIEDRDTDFTDED
jgi:hypothetical protein